MPDLKRIAREIRQCDADTESSGVIVKPVGENLTHLKGVFRGPEETAYAGGTFIVDIQIPGIHFSLYFPILFEPAFIHGWVCSFLFAFKLIAAIFIS